MFDPESEELLEFPWSESKRTYKGWERIAKLSGYGSFEEWHGVMSGETDPKPRAVQVKPRLPVAAMIPTRGHLYTTLWWCGVSHRVTAALANVKRATVASTIIDSTSPTDRASRALSSGNRSMSRHQLIVMRQKAEAVWEKYHNTPGITAFEPKVAAEILQRGLEMDESLEPMNQGVE